MSLARALLFAALVWTPSRLLSAQGDAPRDGAGRTRAAVDSAQAARLAARRAGQALGRHELVVAEREMNRAASAWPAQPAYLLYAASVAARARDTAAALAWIERYSALGIGGHLASDSDFAALRASKSFQRLAAALESEAALARGVVAFSVADSTFHPEGLAYDPRSQRWFVSSVRERRVVAVDTLGSASEFAGDGAGGTLYAVFGMAVDTARGMLWLATSALGRMDAYRDGDRGRAGVVAFDLTSGRRVRAAWVGPDTVERVFGDVAVAPNGDVYVTDSQSGGLFVLRATADTLGTVSSNAVLRSPQGIVVDPDGASVIVADSSHGLVRVDRQTGSAELLDGAPGIVTVGVDGLYEDRGTLVATQNGVVPPRVVRFCLDASRRRVTGYEVLDRSAAVADEPTLGAVGAGAFYYVATGSWEKYDDTGRRVPETTLRPVIALRVPLGPPTCSRGDR